MTPQELEAAGLTQDTKTLEQIVAPEKKAEVPVFDPTSGKWGTYSAVGSGEDKQSVFTPATVQPTTGYAKSISTGTAQDPASSFQWSQGIDPAVTAANKATADAANIWSINAADFHKQVDPLLNQYGDWYDPNGDLSTGAQLTLANGQTWRPSGDSSGITFIPKGTMVGATQGSPGGEGGENAVAASPGVASTEDQWIVRGGLDQLLGTQDSRQHATVTYHEVNGRMEPIAAPETWTWKSPYTDTMNVAKLVLSAYLGGVGGEELGAASTTANNPSAWTMGGTAGGAGGAASSSLLQTIGQLPQTVGSYITPAGTPAWAVNAAGTGAMNAGSALVQGADFGDAVKAGAKGAITGAATYGLDTLGNEILSPILQGTGLSPKDAIAFGKAALTKDSAGLITAGVTMGIDGIAKFSGFDSSKLPSWLTKDNVAGATNLTSGLKTGNLSQVLSGASSLTGSQDVKTAAAATTLYNAAKSGNWTAIASAASALDKVLNGSGTPVVKAPDGADVIKSLVSGAVTDALGVSSAAKKPATPQNLAQAVQDGYMPPKVLAKIKSKFDISNPLALSEMTVEDLVKSVQSDEAAATESENPIYAAQGGSIDDLIEYLRR